MDRAHHSSEPDFDAFLKESVELVDTADAVELLRLAAEEKILGALRKRGVPLLVSDDVEEQMVSTELFMETFRAEDEARLYQTYLETPQLQEETDLEHYVTEHLKHRIISQCQLQEHLLASGVLLIAASEQPDTPSIEHITGQKKKILAAHYANGTLNVGDPWFEVLNEVLPGDPFDPHDEKDSHYIAEALATQIKETATNKIVVQFTKEFLSLLDNAFADDDDADNKINYLCSSLPAVVYLYRSRTVEIDAHIDETVRELEGPAGLAESIKVLMRRISDNLEEFKNRP